MSRSPMPAFVGLITVAGFAILSSAGVRGADAVWNNPAGGSWNTGSNWSTGSAPGTGDNAILPDLGAPYTVTLGSSRTVVALSVLGGASLAGNFSLTCSNCTIAGGVSSIGLLSVIGPLTCAGGAINSGRLECTSASLTGPGELSGTGLLRCSSCSLAGGAVSISQFQVNGPFTWSDGALNTNVTCPSASLTGPGELSGTATLTSYACTISGGTVSIARVQVNGPLTWNGGALVGVVECNATPPQGLTIPADSTGTGAVQLRNGTLQGVVASGQTVVVHTCQIQSAVTCFGTIRMEPASNPSVEISLSTAGGLVIEAGGLLDARRGGGGTREMSGFGGPGGGAVVINRGMISASSDTSLWVMAPFEAAGGSISGPVVLQPASLWITQPASAPSTATLRGDVTLNTDILSGYTFVLEGSTMYPGSSVTNHGSVVLSSSPSWSNSGISTTRDSAAVFTNAADGLVRASAGVGGTRKFTGKITNRGSIEVDDGVTLLHDRLGDMFRQESGMISGAGTLSLRLPGGGPPTAGVFWTGGQILANAVATDSRVTLTPGPDLGGTIALRGSSVLIGEISAGQSVWVQESVQSGISVPSGLVNHGVLHFERTAPSTAFYGLSLPTGQAITNAADGQIVIRQGSVLPGQDVTSYYIKGRLINYGDIDVGAGGYGGVDGAWDMLAGSVHGDGEFGWVYGTGGPPHSMTWSGGSLVAHDVQWGNWVGTSTLAIPPDSTGIGRLAVNGNVTLTGDVHAGQTVAVEGWASWTSFQDAVLTVATGFTNRGTIEFTTYDWHGGRWTILQTSPGGSIYNEVGGTIRVLGPTRGSIVGNVVDAGETDLRGAHILDVTGDFAQPGGTLLLDLFLAGPQPPYFVVHSHLNITGHVSLDGALDVGLTSFIPADGDTFRIMTFASVDGGYDDCADIQGMTFGDNLRWWADTSTGTALDLVVVRDQIGDLDCDCDTDLTDLATLLIGFGTSSGATREMGDLTGDGAVDLTDLATLLTNFGANCP